MRFALVVSTYHDFVTARLADGARAELRESGVADADIDEKSSTITVRFGNGASIVAGPDPNYESWELGHANGDILICGPGGL